MNVGGTSLARPPGVFFDSALSGPESPGQTTSAAIMATGGETIRLQIELKSQSAGGQTSFESLLEFFTVPNAPGTGDLNGDGATDIVDVAVLRRLLVGLPVGS